MWHTLLDGVQLRPAVHDAHDPEALQTSLVPHDVPAVTARPVSVHVATPPVHALTVPWWHGLAGVHAWFRVHALHVPP